MGNELTHQHARAAHRRAHAHTAFDGYANATSSSYTSDRYTYATAPISCRAARKAQGRR